MKIELTSDGALLLRFGDPAVAVRVRALVTEHAPTDSLDRVPSPAPVPMTDGETTSAAGSFQTASGVRGEVRIRVTEAESGADVDVSTAIASGNPEVGVRQTIEALVVDARDPAIFLPGAWVDGNPRTAPGAPSAREAPAWSFRDDRLAWPAAIAFLHEPRACVCLLRRAPASRDAELPLRSGYRHRGVYLLDPSDSDVGAMGFERSEGGAALIAHLPFAEFPQSYQDKRTLLPPIVGAYRATAGTTFGASYRLVVARAADTYEAIEAAARAGIGLWKPTPPDGGDRSVGRIKRSIASHVRGRYFEPRTRRGVAGIYTFVETFGAKPVIGLCEPSFTGKAFWHARNLIEAADAFGDPDDSRRGARVLDTWLDRGVRNGWLSDFWCREIAGIPIDRPFTFDPPRVHPTNPSASLRRLGEAAIALLGAARLRPENGAWAESAARILDQLAALQLPSGGFPRRVRLRDGAPLFADNLGATPTVCAALLAGHRARPNARWIEAARRCGEFLEAEMITPVRFHGSTLDADCEDKEAATETLAALRGLHEATGDDRWIDAARKVAWLALSWFCLVDVPFPKGTMFDAWGLKTRGLTLVSTENNHADIYLFTTPADLRWLAGRMGGDDALSAVAWTSLLSSLQLVATPANPLEYRDARGRTWRIPDGLVPELMYQTLWTYVNKPVVKKVRTWIKGYADHKTSMWTSASVWHSLDAMREVAAGDEWLAYLTD